MTPGPERPARVQHVFTVDLEDYFQVSAFNDVIPFEHWSSVAPQIGRAHV